MSGKFADIGIVGAGIAGLAFAYEAALRGKSVVVFERHPCARGASVRNFGMILPLGMRPGKMHDRAMRSRDVWIRLAERVGFWMDRSGFLIAAYHQDEWEVLAEYASADESGRQGALLDADSVLEISPGIQTKGLIGGYLSRAELLVDPREAIRLISNFLAEKDNVHFQYESTVQSISIPYVKTDGQTWYIEHMIVCTGSNFETLYPDVFKKVGLKRCKLQMMRTVPQPDGWRMGPMLAGGLSLRHYPAFSHYSSLPRLEARVQEQHPELNRWGIHVMAAQNRRGEICLGDSHEYAWMPPVFDKSEIDILILDYLKNMLVVPDLRIAERWHGTYAIHPTDDLIHVEPEPGVHIVNGFGGAGMTTCFGYAQEYFDTN